MDNNYRPSPAISALGAELNQQLAGARTPDERRKTLNRIRMFKKEVENEQAQFNSAPIPAVFVSNQSGDDYAPQGNQMVNKFQAEDEAASGIAENPDLLRDSMIATALNAQTLGWSDEIYDAVGAGGIGDRQRLLIDYGQRHHPWKSTGAGVAGGLLSPATVASGGYSAAGTTLPRVAGRSALAGSAEGALAGSGNARDKSDWRQPAVGAVFGGTLGGGLPIGLNLGGRMFGRGADNTALSKIRNSMRADNVTASDVQALPPTGAPENVLELINRAAGVDNVTESSTGALAQSLASRPGPGRPAMARNLNARSDGHYARVVDNTTDMLPNSGRVDVDQSRAKELYDEYRAQPFDPDKIHGIQRLIDAFPRQMSAALEQGRTSSLANQAEDVAAGIVTRNPDALDWNVLHRLKMGLDDQIGSSKRSGEKGISRDITNLKSAYLTELERANPAYGPARKWYAEEAELGDAFDVGRKVKNTRPKDIQAYMNTLSEPEKAQFRAGGVDSLMEGVDKKVGLEPDYARHMMRNKEAINQLHALVDDPDTVDEFLRTMTAESVGHRTGPGLFGGSGTASRTAAMDAEGFFRSLMDVVNNPALAVNNATARGVGALFGRVGPMERRLGENLTTTEPARISSILSALGGPLRLPGSVAPAFAVGGAIGGIPALKDQVSQR